jgi:hypothetical protein
LLTIKARVKNLSRIITTGSSGKDRLLLEKGIVAALRELSKQSKMDDTTLDLVAYIALSLLAISNTIDASVAAWEKRGYWIKADRYRMDWLWTGNVGEKLKHAIIEEDWNEVAKISAQVTQKLSSVKVAQRNRLGKPWIGSYQKLIKNGSSQ